MEEIIYLFEKTYCDIYSYEITEYSDEISICINGIHLTLNIHTNDQKFDIYTDISFMLGDHPETIIEKFESQEDVIVLLELLYRRNGKRPSTELDTGYGCPFDDVLIGYWRLELKFSKIVSLIRIFEERYYLREEEYNNLLDSGMENFSQEAELYIIFKSLMSDIKNKIKPHVESLTDVFSEKTFLIIHDFVYYCRQHPKSLQDLYEEDVRDLCLLPLKIVFDTSEAEVFNYDGKLDFKVSNPENKYEYISGEFKWWRGNDSLKEAFHQIIRKHSTGQEKELYIVMLSQNKDFNKVKEKIINLIREEEEIIDGHMKTNFLPKGSKEFFIEFLVEIRNNVIPLKVGIADLYYKNY